MTAALAEAALVVAFVGSFTFTVYCIGRAVEDRR